MLKFFADLSGMIRSTYLKSLVLLLLALLSGFLFYDEPFPSYLDASSYRVNVAYAAASQQENSPLQSPLLQNADPQPQSDLNIDTAVPGSSPLDLPSEPLQRQFDAQSTVSAEEPPSIEITATATLTPIWTPIPTETFEISATAIPTEMASTVDISTVDTAIDETPTAEPTELISTDVAIDLFAQQGTPEATRTESTVTALEPFGALFSAESLILGLLCLIFLSINGLGLTALVVTLLYVRSRRE